MKAIIYGEKKREHEEVVGGMTLGGSQSVTHDLCTFPACESFGRVCCPSKSRASGAQENVLLHLPTLHWPRVWFETPPAHPVDEALCWGKRWFQHYPSVISTLSDCYLLAFQKTHLVFDQLRLCALLCKYMDMSCVPSISWLHSVALDRMRNGCPMSFCSCCREPI